MPADPNARRDKALADIASELKNTNKLLAAIEKNTRPVKVSSGFHNDERRMPDPFDIPEQPVPEVSKNEDPLNQSGRITEQPVFPNVPNNPYFQRSNPYGDTPQSYGQPGGA